ncbi:DUF3592 domain-containing protein [Streptomyces flaveus]|uniref:DUF3592 domain-containing protein n=1 Tax=Streptomyces flaveus TaxID=66370 RepID=UPI0033327989
MTTETVLPLLLAAFLALISLGSAYWVRRLYRLRRRGVGAMAEVMRFREVEGSGNDPAYYPVVIFTLPDGTEIEAESDTPSAPLSGVREGSRIHIIYDPDRPTTISTEKGLRTKELAAFALIAVALAYAAFRIAVDVLQ